MSERNGASSDGGLEAVLGAFVSRDRAGFEGARYTENGVELPIGEGLWATVDTIGPYRHAIFDSDRGEAACFATVTEGKSRSIMALRVKRDGGTIREIEAMVARPPLFGGADAFGDGPGALDASGAPDAAWFEPIPESERIDRLELRRIADMYFVGLEKNDGRGEYPFADGCVRIENGFRVTQVPPAPTAGKTPYQDKLRSLSARAQFETAFSASSIAFESGDSRRSTRAAARCSRSRSSITRGPCANTGWPTERP